MRFCWVFICFCSVFTEELSLVVTENDPSSLVEGVSVITGHLYAYGEDYVVEGAEPIRLRSSFISSDCKFKGDQHLTAMFFLMTNHLVVNEHNGSPLVYGPDPKNKIEPIIGKHFYGRKGEKLRYYATEGVRKGVILRTLIT